MTFLSVEIKARTEQLERIRAILTARNALFKGIDHQVDTYFHCNYGRLKLRQGTIENHLIHYSRKNKAGPKDSMVTLYQPNSNSQLKEVLTKSLGILVIVKKAREIYFIDNVKFHLDTVEQLGSFLEIEAIDKTGTIGRKRLLQQCEYYLSLFQIGKQALVKNSYSDMPLSSD